MSSRRPTGGSDPKGSGSRPHPRKETAASAARRRASRGRTQSGSATPKPNSRPQRSAPSTPAASARSRTQRSGDSSSGRFTKKFNVTFTGGQKTRQLSLRFLVVIFFAVIGVVIISGPLGQYLDQQQEKRELVQELEETSGRVELLEQELARWEDPDFVRSQARERLGYVLPGETLYLVSDPDEGTAGEIMAERTQEVNDRRRQATPFYVTMWDSIQIAGSVGEIENPSNVPLIGETTTPDTDEPTAVDTPDDGESSSDETETTVPDPDE